MLACGFKVPGARISDFGFILVVLVSLIAGIIIIMGMKMAFNDQDAYREEREQAMAIVIDHG